MQTSKVKSTDLPQGHAAAHVITGRGPSLMLVGLFLLPLASGMVFAQARPKQSAVAGIFSEAAEATGLQFVHYNG
jgi:hypothetical protein